MTKYCPNCGKPLNKSDRYCRNCGRKIGVLAEKPKADRKGNRRRLALWKIVLLQVITLGLYEAYWGYKQWWYMKEISGEKMSPSVRGFFVWLTCFGLFSRMANLSKKAPLSGHTLYSILFFGFGLSLWGISRADYTKYLNDQSFWIALLILLVFQGLILARMQAVMNAFWKNNRKGIREAPVNIGLIFLLIVIGIATVVWGLSDVEQEAPSSAPQTQLKPYTSSGFTRETPSSVPQAQWKPYASSGFTILFPTTPTEETETGTSDSGIPVTATIYLTTGTPSFSVASYTYSNASFDLNEAIRGMAVGKNGVVYSNVATSFQGHPAQQYVVKVNDQHFLSGIIFSVNDSRTYALMEESSIERPPDFQWFVNSFKAT